VKQRLSPLDFLRGIALLGVLVVHTSQSFPSISYRLGEVYFFGRYGVQLFFAVSGFTIMMMYQSYLDKWETPVKVFYLKRILRLYPLFFVAAFAYIPLFEHYSNFNPDGLQAMDLVRVLTLTGGIDPHLLNAVVPGGWSIIDEIYFYLLFPIMFMAYGRVNMVYIGLLIAGLNIALNLSAETVFAGREPWLIEDFLYRNILNNIVVFYAGIEAWRRLNKSSCDFLKIWVPFAIASVVVQYLRSDHTGIAAMKEVVYLFLDHQAPMMSSAAMAFIIHWVMVLSFRIPKLSQPQLEKFGTVTYTGYITHFGIIALAEMLVHQFGLTNVARFELMIIPITAVTALVSFSIVKWTEHYWQNLANQLCANWFSRKNSATAPNVVKAGA
tara:strand:+ start:4317 stop:5465 length:1149 start_codon:yes stop_codon:yes gene_type:complete